LLSGVSQQQACDQAGVSRSTLRLWKQQESFTGALQAAQDEAFAESLSKVKVNATAAVDTLLELMTAGKQDVRARCAALILEHGIKIRQVEELEKRLAMLEQAVGTGR
ncbi:MAG: hypothetical protein U1E51_24800, partial [Candidatus Binatia bacterium]|nr:hypothetical protein [Candidatus Binatia bacterium]